jgi:antitoxin component YwqK of YwqJK toxin-antitoxin module
MNTSNQRHYYLNGNVRDDVLISEDGRWFKSYLYDYHGRMLQMITYKRGSGNGLVIYRDSYDGHDFRHRANYVNGRAEGENVATKESDEINQHDSKGRWHGLCNYFHTNGRLAYIGSYDHGIQVGLWSWWGSDENIWAKHIYDCGIAEGEAIGYDL